MTAETKQTIDVTITALTPILVPVIIAGIKKLWARIPNKYLPAIAPLIGVAIDIISNQALMSAWGIGAGTALGAALGFAGVGLREGWDQWSGNAAKPSRLDPGPPPPRTIGSSLQ